MSNEKIKDLKVIVIHGTDFEIPEEIIDNEYQIDYQVKIFPNRRSLKTFYHPNFLTEKMNHIHDKEVDKRRQPESEFEKDINDFSIGVYVSTKYCTELVAAEIIDILKKTGKKFNFELSKNWFNSENRKIEKDQILVLRHFDLTNYSCPSFFSVSDDASRKWREFLDIINLSFS